MPYIRLIDGQPEWVTKNDIRLENPGTSFPVHMGPNEMAAWGCIPVRVLDEPDVSKDQVATLDALPTLQGDEWVQGWTVRDKTVDELLKTVPWQNYVEARKAVVVWINNLTAQIEALYPSAVQKRWEIEEAAARAVKANDGGATQDQVDLVTREGAAKGRTPEEHADAIIANADRFRAIADQTNTLFLATDAQLQAAQSPLEYPDIFTWAQQQAAPLAAAYGLEMS